MAKAVLTTKIDPAYDDLPEQRYHFPRTYLRQVEAALHDWIVYYEPRRSSAALSSRGGRQSYFATARIVGIERDAARPDHFYARVDSYLDFTSAIPFSQGGTYLESAIQREDGGTNKGAFGRAVRSLPDHEYTAILHAAFGPILTGAEAGVEAVAGIARPASRPPLYGFAEAQAAFDLPVFEPPTTERPIVERVIARPFRDAAFSGAIKSAYGDRCAFTGLRIINGGGRSEVQAAHIRPVAASGPDSLRNGVALCGTMHWMFDRGLIAIADDHALLLADGQVPDQVTRMLNPARTLLAPSRPEQMPHPQFLRWHREHVFKGSP